MSRSWKGASDVRRASRFRFVLSWLLALVALAAVPRFASAQLRAERPPPRTAPNAAITVDEILRAVLRNNPELAEARLLTRASRAQASGVSRLPDPELDYQLWAQPLARPWALGDAQMHMVGVRQALPAPGTLGNRARAADARGDVAAQTERSRQLELVARVRRAFAAYYLADRQYRLHLEHGQRAHQVTELTSLAYRAGRGTQQDIVRAELSLARLHNQLTNLEAERQTAQGLLNTLMGRPVDAPLPANASSVAG